MYCCVNKSNKFQPLLSNNPLKKRSNYSLDKLIASLDSTDSSDSKIYYYVMTTIQKCGDALQHNGSGPNWQKGIITLCTCKHYMRSLLKVEDWQGVWVAGLSTANKQVGSNFLIYLMRVDNTFESHFRLWNELPKKVRQAKAANRGPFGDIFQPLGKETQENPFNVCSYYPPHQSHSRKYNWPQDIDYSRNDNHNDVKRAALLVGNDQYSYVWDKCKIVFEPGTIGRGHRKDKLKDFLRNRLRDAD